MASFAHRQNRLARDRRTVTGNALEAGRTWHRGRPAGLDRVSRGITRWRRGLFTEYLPTAVGGAVLALHAVEVDVMRTRHVVLVDETGTKSASELSQVATALQTQTDQDLAPAWGCVPR